MSLHFTFCAIDSYSTVSSCVNWNFQSFIESNGRVLFNEALYYDTFYNLLNAEEI